MTVIERDTETKAYESSAQVLMGDAAASLQALPGCSVDCVITDPPYGLTASLDIRDLLTTWLNGDIFVDTQAGYAGNDWDNTVPGPELWSEVHRVLQPGGFVLAFAAARTLGLTTTALQLAGFVVRDTIHWTYATGQQRTQDLSRQHERSYGVRCPELSGLRSTLRPAHEPIVVAHRPLDTSTVMASELERGIGAINHGERLLSNVWHSHDVSCTPEVCLCGAEPFNSATKHIYPGESITTASIYCPKPSASERPVAGDGQQHDTVKPLALMRELVRAFTKPGQTVLDPFLGSGTTAEAALLEDRNVIGCERDHCYRDLIEARLVRCGAQENPCP